MGISMNNNGVANMNKKVTVKDVAREAGVSVATVSYIMNDRTDQKISPETRKKVLQIANLLNYRPSHAAKSLATGRNNIIGIAYSLHKLTPARNMEITNLLHLLIERLNRMKYDVLFFSFCTEQEDISVSINSNIDAIIAIDLTHNLFKKLADSYLVPVIAVDMLINDNLFYQIYTDYPTLITQAISEIETDYYLFLDDFANKEYQHFITANFPQDHILPYSDMTPEKLTAIRNNHVIILGTHLALIALPYLCPDKMHVITSDSQNIWFPDSVQMIPNDLYKKANLTINILLNALDRNFEINHDLKVL